MRVWQAILILFIPLTSYADQVTFAGSEDLQAFDRLIEKNRTKQHPSLPIKGHKVRPTQMAPLNLTSETVMDNSVLPPPPGGNRPPIGHPDRPESQKERAGQRSQVEGMNPPDRPMRPPFGHPNDFRRPGQERPPFHGDGPMGPKGQKRNPPPGEGRNQRPPSPPISP